MQNGVVQHFELPEFPNELDVAKHLPLGQKPRLFLVVGEVSGALLISGGNSSSIFELIFAFTKQQSFKGGNLTFWRFKVGSILVEPFAQLCVHGTVLRFIESLFEDLKKEFQY